MAIEFDGLSPDALGKHFNYAFKPTGEEGVYVRIPISERCKSRREDAQGSGGIWRDIQRVNQ
jgi:hypothetical protein